MRADIFCKRVDNYGDIGVCWRLARRLRQAAAWQVRLWIDDLPAFRLLEPRCDASAPEQDIDGVRIVWWSPTPPSVVPGDVVIEAFACDPPPAFRLAMRERRPAWINLEYLSAEPWVESCHRLPSPQSDGLMKYFFFPGFTPATGGLLREPDLPLARDRFQCSEEAQHALLGALGVPAQVVAARAAVRLVTLFCYPDAPLASLAAALRRDRKPTVVLVPEGVAPGLEAQAAAAGTALRIVRIPFLPQDDYDRLLWCADLNFVRGEDSLVRGSWAARPLVWQIYPQADGVHLDKLDAWLRCYGAPPPAQALIRAWNTGAATEELSAAWDAATAPAAWQAWREGARAWEAEYRGRPDLASNLVSFCAELRHKC
ncbi:elongation factor P maturation arginine rhamnosyltransferase EarP [Bordetella flabilis]|uniref:Protein-arginine rhamnosyltransferase n=1 Tax=Bordetella flabilis TaxID=463014 RepID=A0A193GG94_9BORD|nr:elongation factor P maturation arginine rhamnosyltransferase EarP [Bordetella flabilis]ANN78835.1 hypothetical protein BAU07_18440 [Bordetella flabilis]